MKTSTLVVGLVALLHIGFFILESMLWSSPEVMRIFDHTPASSEATYLLALNQGFYNLGAAILLLWLHYSKNGPGVMAVLTFLFCMGLVGGVTASGSIFFVQSLPALLALVLLYARPS